MISEKSIEIKPFFVMEILERAQEMERAGKDIIHLEIGEPDFETPECIREAAISAIRNGKTKYTHSQGLLELREAIALHYLEKYGVSIAPENITVTSGTSPAMALAFSAFLKNGGKVALPNPSYPCYPSFIRAAGGIPLWIDTEESNGFCYERKNLARAMTENPSLCAVILNSPSNPAGQLTPSQAMQEMAELGKTIISDEIYHGLTYGAKEHSVLEFTDNAFVVNGFSKRYAMTGWRLGYVISPPTATRFIQKLHQNLYISANSFVQWAGIAALEEAGPELELMRKELERRREVLMEGLRRLGFSISLEPGGAFYVIVNARHIHDDSLVLAGRILEEAQVAVAPGIDFGSRAEGFLRFSYTTSVERIEEALERIGRFIERNF